MCAGLWSRYFLVMFKGEKLPAVPVVPPLVHRRKRVQVPYTPAEVAKRTVAYKVKMKTYDKTMQVILCGYNAFCTQHWYVITSARKITGFSCVNLLNNALLRCY